MSDISESTARPATVTRYMVVDETGHCQAWRRDDPTKPKLYDDPERAWRLARSRWGLTLRVVKVEVPAEDVPAPVVRNLPVPDLPDRRRDGSYPEA